MIRIVIIIAAALSLGVQASATASIVNWGANPGTKIANTHVNAGTFDDDYEFTLTSAKTSTSSAVATDLSNFFVASGATYSLVSFGQDNAFGTADDQTLMTWTFNGTSGSTVNALNLAAGNYYFGVNGVATGSGGGLYLLQASTAPVAPVPLPGTAGIMVMGLGLLRAAARRKITPSDSRLPASGGLRPGRGGA